MVITINMWPSLGDILKTEALTKDTLYYFNLVSHVYNLTTEQKEDVDFLATKIQEMVLLPHTRCSGLVIFAYVLEQNPKFYLGNWGQIVLGSLKCSESYIPVKLVLNILNLIVRNFGETSEHREYFHKVIPDILSIILKMDHTLYEVACQSLAVCMNYLPAIVECHVDEIETFLLKGVDSTSTETIEAIAECFAALPLCLTYFHKQRTSYAELWRQVYFQIIHTVQYLLNDIFTFSKVEVTLVDVSAFSVFSIPLPEESTCSVLAQMRAVTAFCRCLARLLCNDGCKVEVPVADLFGVFQRLFKISEKETRCTLFKLGFPVMLMGFYTLLEALIHQKCINVSYSGNFVKILNEFLSTTNTIAFGLISNSYIRSCTWKLLNVLLLKCGSQCSCDIVNDKFLLQELLNDITDTESKEKSKTQVKGNKVKILGIMKDLDKNKSLACSEALEVLKNMLIYGHQFMEKNSRNIILSTVMETASNLMSYLHPSMQFPVPYHEEICRERLFKILRAGLSIDLFQTKYALQVINLLRLGLKDPSMMVVDICRKAFIFGRPIIHPKKPAPEAIMYSNSDMLMRPEAETVLPAWDRRIKWSVNNHSGERLANVAAPGISIQNVYSNSVENEADMMHIDDQIEEGDNEEQATYDWKAASKRSSQSDSEELDEEEEEEEEDDEMKDVDDSEPAYIPANPIPHRMSSSHSNSIGMQSSLVDQQIAEVRTEECPPEEVMNNVPTYNNGCENAGHLNQNSIEHVMDEEPGLVVAPENGTEEYEEEESDVDEEEGEDDDAEGEVESEYVMEGKRSPEYFDERIVKRQKFSTEEEESSDEEEEVINNNSNNNQSPEPEEEEEEETVMNNLCTESEKHLEANDKENQNNEESKNEESGNRSPTIKEMCGDFVLAEPEDSS